MKNSRPWSQGAALVLYIGLCVTGCQRSSDNANTSKAESAPAHSVVQEITQKELSTPTPKPVQRTDVRITGLMIGTGVDARNEITNPSPKYKTSDSIYALVRISGSGPEAAIKLECKDQEGKVVFDENKKITSNGEASMIFNLTASKRFSTGDYRLVGLLDNYPTMAVSFSVAE